MKTIEQWFAEYGISHQHPHNVAIHVVAVPAIVLSIVGLLWSLPFFVDTVPFFNWASIALALVLCFHARLSKTLAVGFAATVVIMMAFLWWLERVNVNIPVVMMIIFVIAWVMQFIGHHLEGKRPSFLEDLLFLLIGPLWLLAKVYRKAKIPW